MSIDTIELEEAPANAPVACQSCDWRGKAGDATYACDYVLTPGDPSPAGRCPECECTVYLDRPEDRAREAAMELLQAVTVVLLAYKVEWTIEDRALWLAITGTERVSLRAAHAVAEKAKAKAEGRS